MAHLRFLAHTLVVSALFFISCSGDDNKNSTGPPVNSGAFPSELVDTWSYESVMVNGSPASLSVTLDWVSGAVSASIKFFADGDYSYHEFNAMGSDVWFEDGTVTVTGANIIVTAIRDKNGPLTKSYSGTYSISADGDTLTVRATINGDSIVFLLQ